VLPLEQERLSDHDTDDNAEVKRKNKAKFTSIIPPKRDIAVIMAEDIAR